MKTNLQFLIIVLFLNSCENVQRTYYESGALKSEKTFVNNEGKLLTYFESGQLKEEFKIVKGEISGLGKMYYKTGELHVEGLFANDTMTNCTFYDKNGVIYNKSIGREEYLYQYILDGDTSLYKVSHMKDMVDSLGNPFKYDDTVAYFKRNKLILTYSLPSFEDSQHRVTLY